MNADRTALLVVGVAAVVLVGSLGLVVGVPGLDSGDAGSADPTGSADDADSEQYENGADDSEGSESEGDDSPDRVEFDQDEPLDLDPEEPVLSGVAEVDSGTELHVQLLTAPDEDSPFFLQQETTADESGAFDVEFDLSDVVADEETGIEVAVHAAGEEEPLANASVTLTDPTATAESNGDSDESDEEDRVKFDHEIPVEIDPADAVVSGTADTDAGTELHVQLMSAPGEDSPFFMQETATVGDDGSFDVEFEFQSSVDPGTKAELVLSVAESDEQLGDAAALFVDADE